ncbi:MAG TPA: hypothetical protein VHX68_10285 [Planctomycetaceae bacterium]|nr:hypothetical protein [Planctomycetaceae bacterium]
MSHTCSQDQFNTGKLVLQRDVAQFLRAAGFTPADFNGATSALEDRRRKAGGS